MDELILLPPCIERRGTRCRNVIHEAINETNMDVLAFIIKTITTNIVSGRETLDRDTIIKSLSGQDNIVIDRARAFGDPALYAKTFS